MIDKMVSSSSAALDMVSLGLHQKFRAKEVQPMHTLAKIEHLRDNSNRPPWQFTGEQSEHVVEVLISIWETWSV